MTFSRIHLASQTIVRLLPEPWVCQMMPPSLPLHVILRGPDAEILVVAAELLGPGVEDDEVVDQLQEARLAAQLDQRPVQQVFDRAVFLPGQVILLRRLDRAVTQALGVVARP